MANKFGRTAKKEAKINLDENSRLHIMAVSTAPYAATVDLVFYRLLLYIYTDFFTLTKILFEFSTENLTLGAGSTPSGPLNSLAKKHYFSLYADRLVACTTK